MRQVLAQRLVSMRQTEAMDRWWEDPEGVHDMRVSTRRLIAALDASGDMFSRAWFRPLKRTVKALADALGDVRDNDVQLAFLQQQRGQLPVAAWPGVDRLIDRVQRERDAASTRLLAVIRDPDARAARTQAATCLGVERAEVTPA
jgi:CHAD domain-containing protein